MQNGDMPKLISFKNHQDSRGIMGILEDQSLPFKVQRWFWIRQVPEGASRGGHAHKSSRQLIICLQGAIEVDLEGPSIKKQHYTLEPHQNQLLYLPPLYWGYYTFKNNAIALCMASDYFDEADYIRDYRKFEQLKHDH